MDLRKLVYFATIAECASFTKASEKLCVAQSALSRQIKLLEDELEVELFLRTSKAVELSTAGEALLEHAYGLIHGFERAKADIQDLRGTPKGTVVIGVPPSLGPIVMPEVVKRIQGEFPHLSLKIREGTSVVMEEWLAKGRIDLALLGHAPTSLGLRGEILTEEQIGLIGRTDLIESARAVGFTAFADLPLVMTLQVELLLDERLRKARAIFPSTVEIDSIQVVKALLRHGAGLTMMPVGFFRSEIARDELRAVPIHGSRLTRPIALAFSLSRPMSAAATQVAELVRAEVAALVAARTFTITSTPGASAVFLPASRANRRTAATAR